MPAVDEQAATLALQNLRGQDLSRTELKYNVNLSTMYHLANQ